MVRSVDNTSVRLKVIARLGLAGLLLVSIVACTGPEEAATATPGPPATSTPVMGNPPDIPAGHSIARCGVCHEKGIAGVPQWPDNHVGFAEQECGGCHEAARP
jgi:cytochrome c5